MLCQIHNPAPVNRRRLLTWLTAAGLTARAAIADQNFETDAHGRILLPVFVNGRGPFRFMLDTGAQISAVSNLLAREMRLSTDDSGYVVRGVIDTVPTPAVLLNELRCDTVSIGATRTALLGEKQLADLDGILGADLLRNATVDLDFVNRRFALNDAVNPPLSMPAQRLRLTQRFGGLVALRIRIGTVNAWAILDTAATHSIGNEYLRKALGIRRDFDPSRDAVIADVAAGTLPAIVAATPVMALGKRQIAGASLRFAALPLFERWGWHQQAAILLGLDRLTKLGRLQINYAKSQLLLPSD